jgi:type IV secretion system protein VirB5
MKKKLIAIAFSTVVLAGTPQVYATGVPTVDAANLVQLKLDAVAQAQQALDALNTAKDAIQQAEKQYNNYKSIVTGNDQLGSFLSNPAMNKILPMGDWSQIYRSVQDIASLRNRYGLRSSNASVQARFDEMLAVTDALERTYNASTERVNNAEQLRAKLDTVQTPQQKEDLQLRYQQELIEQNNQQMRLANMQMLQQQQEKMEDAKRAQDFQDYILGKTTVLPSYN